MSGNIIDPFEELKEKVKEIISCINIHPGTVSWRVIRSGHDLFALEIETPYREDHRVYKVILYLWDRPYLTKERWELSLAISIKDLFQTMIFDKLNKKMDSIVGKND